MTLATNPLNTLTFGEVDAESDTRLADFFVDTGVLKRLGDGSRQFVIGRKGSGKTALFQQAQTSLKANHIIPMEFSEYAWEQHKAVKELGLPAEGTYAASWTFTFLIASCNVWRASRNPEIAKAAQVVYEKIFGPENTGTLGALFDKLKRLRRLDLPNAGDLGGLGGFELEDIPDGSRLARAANLWNQKLIELADVVYRLEPTTVLVDRLDDGWDATQDIRDMLAGAIKAARAINLRYGRINSPRPILVFLRSDIFSELAFNDKNKLSGTIEYLEWDDDELLLVVKQRIAKSLGVPQSGAWEHVFSPDQMRQRAFISSYMLKRTMQRPRDIIAFCKFCRDSAVKEGHTRIETSDIYEGETGYSRHVFDELTDEIHKQVPDFASLFKSLRLLGYTRFKFASWFEAEKRLQPAISETIAGQRLKTLFDCGVIGVPRVGGRRGGSTFEFAFQDRYLDPRFDSDLVVHPSLRKQLSLRDATAETPNVPLEDGDDALTSP